MPLRPSFDPAYSTAELTATFAPERTIGAILEFESALAGALGDLGIAPAREVDSVVSACESGVKEPAAVLDTTWSNGTPIISLRDEVTSNLSPEEARWFHHGATTQDAMDTGMMLQSREALGHLDRGLQRLALLLRDLTIEWRDQPHLARTFLQDAEPTVFGLRVAGWLQATVAHKVDLESRGTDLAVQLGGAVGTLAAFGDHGVDVRQALADRLGLTDPAMSWHSDRTRVLSLAHGLQRCATSMAKTATDISLLASSAIGEISVRSGRSSSMPDKENPIDSIRAIAAASACNGGVAMLTSAPPIELDRGVGGWHVEWLALPTVFQTAGAAVEAVTTAVESLDVHTAAMENDVDAPSGSGTQRQIDAVLEWSGQYL